MNRRLEKRLSKVEGDSQRYSQREIAEYRENVWDHVIWRMDMMLFRDGKASWPGDEPDFEFDPALENAAFPMPQHARHLSDEEREEEMEKLLLKMDRIYERSDHAPCEGVQHAEQRDES